MDKPIVILGGGLWGGLLAYRLSLVHPEKKFVIFEAESHFGGNHTWSFHHADVDEEQIKWLSPFIKRSWPGYTVHFPELSRQVEGNYYSISSDRFHEVLNQKLSENVQFDTSYSLEEAKKLGSFVIDARGRFQENEAGYQKFVGFEVNLEEAHNLGFPILMDANVPQKDGYRFLYYLPFSNDILLVEDTRYSSNSSLDENDFENEILAEIKKRGWRVKSIARKEKGVLPIPLTKINPRSEKQVIDLAGILHDTTGYSLPDAVRLIDLMMKTDLSEDSVQACVNDYRKNRESDRGFFRLLNRLMFEAAEEQERYRVFQHFYRLPEPLMARFYKGTLSGFDRARLFIGRPPVPVLSAIKCLIPQKRRVKA